MIFRITSDPKYWGNGYTSEAANRVLAFAFEENNVYRVTTGCLAENRGSERVMQKNERITIFQTVRKIDCME
ncbi:MAG: GNAT family N-acetyltransferase [Clostridiales bacterium]|nr:GNAT family N-acetyltransferase [Clostridiales bacterium]